jgi:hypothetical protein
MEQRGQLGGATGKGFMPGRSGNPGGRPKSLRAVAQLAQAHSASAILALVEVMHHGKPHAARVHAAVALLDRGWGKPRQSLDMEGGPPVILASALEDARQLFDERMARIVAAHDRDGQASVLSHPKEAERSASSGNDGASAGPQADCKSAGLSFDEKWAKYFGDGRPA